jgi:hypothetical protein
MREEAVNRYPNMSFTTQHKAVHNTLCFKSQEVRELHPMGVKTVVVLGEAMAANPNK